jgi:hypothetical protein
MIKQVITYEDFAGNQRTEEFYFHLAKHELVKMSVEKSGGLASLLREISSTQDHEDLLTAFELIVAKAYGLRTEDNKSFLKKPEYSQAFLGSNAWDVLFMTFMTDAKAAAEFTNGLIPPNLLKEVEEMAEKKRQEKNEGAQEEANRPRSTNVISGTVVSGTVETKPEEYSEEALLSMPQDEFDRIIGTDINKMSAEHFRIAFRRKNQQLV